MLRVADSGGMKVVLYGEGWGDVVGAIRLRLFKASLGLGGVVCVWEKIRVTWPM